MNIFGNSGDNLTGLPRQPSSIGHYAVYAHTTGWFLTLQKDPIPNPNFKNLPETPD